MDIGETICKAVDVDLLAARTYLLLERLRLSGSVHMVCNKLLYGCILRYNRCILTYRSHTQVEQKISSRTDMSGATKARLRVC